MLLSTLVRPASTPFAAALVLLPLVVLSPSGVSAQALESFALIGGQSITNTGPTTINGNIAISPGTSYTGSDSVTQTGETFLGDEVAARAQNDLTTLYNVLAGRPTSAGGNLTGQDLGGQTLAPGVYNFDTSAGLAAGQTLTLDAGGNPDAVFIFNIGSTLTTGSGSQVLLQNGAQGGNVFFRVGSSATLDTSSDLAGQIVALTSITLNTEATIGCGAALARNGSVTLDTNTITRCTLQTASFGEVLEDTTSGGTPSGGTPPTAANVRSVSGALDEFVAEGGLLPAGFAILPAALSPTELAAALSQLSGEVATGVAPSVSQSMDSFLNTVLSSERLSPRPPAVSAGRPAPTTLVVSDEYIFMDKFSGPQVSTRGIDFPTGTAPQPVPAQPRWGIWGAVYGDHSVTEGSLAERTHERTSDDRGIAIGGEVFLDPTTTIGISAGYGTATFDLEGDRGHGESVATHAALYGRKSVGAGYVLAALAYGRYDMSTDRTVTVAGFDRFTSDFTVHDISGHVEGGYRFGRITPYAALRGHAIRVSGYSETVASGSSTFALEYDEYEATSVRSELGIGVDWQSAPTDDRAISMGIRAAWAHEFGSSDDLEASFQSLPGSSFSVAGATPDRNSLLVSAGAEFGRSTGLHAAASFDGRFSQNSKSYGPAIKIGYRW